MTRSSGHAGLVAVIVRPCGMAEADQIDARSRTATRPSLQRVAALARLEATVEPSVCVALLVEAERVAVRMAQLHPRGPPASSRGWRSRFETLTHADLVYEVNVDPDGEPYTLTATANAAFCSATAPGR